MDKTVKARFLFSTLSFFSLAGFTGIEPGIDNRDYQTKRAFSFPMSLFTLAETGTPERAPVLTIPTG